MVVLPLALRWGPSRSQPAGQGGAQARDGGFFSIPYITWFLLHYVIATLGILAVIALAVDNVINESAVSALLGSLLRLRSGKFVTRRRRSGRDGPARELPSCFPSPASSRTPGSLASR